MSLYYEAVSFIAPSDTQESSLKSRIYNAKNLKSKPAQLFALVSEASKWSSILKEVVENSQLLLLERKLSPALGLLLVHDLLLARRGIAAPASHPLRLAVERHKARVLAELTKARLRKGFSSVDALRQHVDQGRQEADVPEQTHKECRKGNNPYPWPHPRWVRINTLKTSLAEQLATTFVGYRTVDRLEEIIEERQALGVQILHIDIHVPDLIALPRSADLSNFSAYKNGLLILQDKASCFPAFLLDPQLQDGYVVDACAAPGNKTTHLAALGQLSQRECGQQKIWACERDKARAAVLQKMVNIAGAENLVTVKVGQDFLRIDPDREPWCSAGALLLDPSCSGSGIIGRENTISIILPSKEASAAQTTESKKRKRKRTQDNISQTTNTSEEVPIPIPNDREALKTRLQALSTFQTKLLLHAFRFPRSRKVTYSTCSLYAEENELVVLAALASPIAKERGWKILLRDKQVDGMKGWAIRGDAAACSDDMEIAEACIRCNKGTKEGTQGFFVAAFVRDQDRSDADEDEWGGLSDSAGDSDG
ncbi:hypothetical protein MMC11_005357 [Xylographa trunciseda]|nr:hypothetical protein [Xylographa trunciseda]